MSAVTQVPVSKLADEDMQGAPTALIRAGQRAREIAARTGTPLIFSNNGVIVRKVITLDMITTDFQPAPINKEQQGYSLVELAVVMLIVSLLIGGLLLPLSAQQEVRNRSDTERTLTDIQAALIGYAIVTGRLPRPATSATNGSESATPCTTDALCTGFIPWSTLSTSKIDGWGKLIRYSVTPAYAGGASGTTLIALTSIANRTVQTRDSAGATSYLAGRAACSAADQCVAAVIFSHGRNRLGTLDGGTATPASSITNLDEIANNAGPTAYFSRTTNDNSATTGGEFDDIVTWIPTYTIVNRLVAVGKLP